MNVYLFLLILFSAHVYADEWKVIDHYQVKDGVAKDLNTGLIWMRCSIGQNWYGLLGYGVCQGEAKNISNLNDVQAISTNYEYAGYTDWRVPSFDELMTIMSCPERIDLFACIGDEKKSPFVDHAIFPQTSSFPYLSSNTKYLESDGGGTIVYFSHESTLTAAVGWKPKGFSLRLVRGESNLAKPIITNSSATHDSGIINNEIDYGVTVSVSIINSGKQGSIPIKVLLSSSEGNWLKQQKITMVSGESRNLKFFFPEPTVNATNISYQIDTGR